MADTTNLSNFLTDVAEAIRNKTGNTETIPAANFDTEIDSIVTVNNQDKTVTPSTNEQTITADDGYTGLGTVTVNGVDNMAKVFETVEDMNNDTTAEEGDLAVVYKSETTNVTETTSFRYVYLPETITLTDEEAEELSANTRIQSYYFYNEAKDSNPYIRIYIYSYEYASQSMITIRTKDGSYNVNYTNAGDNKTFTREDNSSITYPIDLGDYVSYYSEGASSSYAWRDMFGYFLQSHNVDFEGLYEYQDNEEIDTSRSLVVDISSIEVDTENQSISYNVKNIDFSKELIGNIVTELVEKQPYQYLSQVGILSKEYKTITFFSCSNISTGSSTRNSDEIIGCYNNNLYILYSSASSGTIPSGAMVTYSIDTGEITTAEITDYVTFYRDLEGDTLWYGVEISNEGYAVSDTDSNYLMIYYYEAENTWVTLDVYTDKIGSDAYGLSYSLASTQLNAIANNVYNSTFYGANGIEDGTLGTEISSTFDDDMATLYSTIHSYYFSLPTIVVTDDNYTTVFGQTNTIVIPDCVSVDTSSCTTFKSMFNGCSDLVYADLKNFNTETVTDMSYMFKSCGELTDMNLSSFNTSNVTTMLDMFINCSKLEKIDVSNFNTSNVTKMDGMFENCTKLKTLDLSNFDTSNVVNFASMFNGCTSLETLDISSFDVSNGETIYYMFAKCSSLEELDLSNWTLSSSLHLLSGMFEYCTNLKSLNISSWDITNIGNMLFMFKDCSSLESLDLSNFTGTTDAGSNSTQNTYSTSAKQVYEMFSGCSSLVTLDISGLTWKGTNSSIFDGCTSLETVYVKDSTSKTNCDTALSAAGLSITSTIKS